VNVHVKLLKSTTTHTPTAAAKDVERSEVNERSRNREESIRWRQIVHAEMKQARHHFMRRDRITQHVEQREAL
jgi:hypothetical protein